MQLNLSDKFKLKEFGAVKEYRTDPIPLNDLEIKLIQEYDFNTWKKKEFHRISKELKSGKIEKHKESFYISNIENKHAVMERTRNQMLLQVSTGLRVSDLFRIKRANIKGDLIIMRPLKT
jgi:hypothetical protein